MWQHWSYKTDLSQQRQGETKLKSGNKPTQEVKETQQDSCIAEEEAH